MNPTQDLNEDMDIVGLWLRKDPIRWVSGALAGATSGLIAIVLAMLLTSMSRLEFWFPVKLIGAIALGPSATVVGSNFGAIITGFILFEIMTMVLGAAYAHFARTSFLPALLGMGLVWGAFTWIFIWNLFFQSFKAIFAAQVSSGAAFVVCMVFGMGLTAVAFFDRAIRGKDL